jgi:hypothetical protein
VQLIQPYSFVRYASPMRPDTFLGEFRVPETGIMPGSRRRGRAPVRLGRAAERDQRPEPAACRDRPSWGKTVCAGVTSGMRSAISIRHGLRVTAACNHPITGGAEPGRQQTGLCERDGRAGAAWPLPLSESSAWTAGRNFGLFARKGFMKRSADC